MTVYQSHCVVQDRIGRSIRKSWSEAGPTGWSKDQWYCRRWLYHIHNPCSRPHCWRNEGMPMSSLISFLQCELW